MVFQNYIPSDSNVQSGLKINVIRNFILVLSGVAQVVGVSSCGPKGLGFDSQSGHRYGSQVQSLVGACRTGNWSMFLFHMGVPLHLSLPSFPSL